MKARQQLHEAKPLCINFLSEALRQQEAAVPVLHDVQQPAANALPEALQAAL